MKPYGREKNLKGGGAWKRNVKFTKKFPKRIYRNWWEDIIQPLSRGALKQRWRKEMKKELD